MRISMREEIRERSTNTELLFPQIITVSQKHHPFFSNQFQQKIKGSPVFCRDRFWWINKMLDLSKLKVSLTRKNHKI